MVDKITPGQIRAARAFLGWSMVDLANAATVSVSTIKRIADDSLRSATERSVILVQDALEAAGVRFLVDDGEGLGVRYKAR